MHRIITLLLLTFMSTWAMGQVTITGQSEGLPEDYRALDEYFNGYQVFRIDVDKETISSQTNSFLLDLVLDNMIFELIMFKGNIQMSFEADNKPEVLGGSFRSGGTVSLTINDDFIFGYLKYGSSQYYIEPAFRFDKNLDSDLFVFYNVKNIKDNKEHQCGVDLVNSKTPREPNFKMPTTMCKIVDYAIANTFNMISALGSTTNVMNFNMAVLNDVQTNYRSEFDTNLEFDVVATYIPTSSSTNPYDPITTSTNGNTLLTNFRRWARGPGNAGGGNSGGATGGFGVDYTQAGVWTDTDFSGGVVGIAYTPGWHHILENYTDAAFSLKSMVSHEMGHNWNFGHDGGGTYNIMAPTVTLTDVWSSASKTAISSRIAAQTYLDNCSIVSAPTADFFQNSIAVCTNEDIEFEDQSLYGATRSWTFTNGTPATSTSEKPNVSFSTVGLHSFEITSDNATGSDSKMGYVDIFSSGPPTICTPSGTGGSTEIDYFTIGPITHESSGTGVYEDFSCSVSGTLEEDSDYEWAVGVKVTTTGTYWVRCFADYNNDGDFTDPGETSGQFGRTLSSWPSSNPPFVILNINLTTPSSVFGTPTAPVTGDLLRFRVIASSSNISSGCTNPSNGQVEDYSVYFEEPQVFGCTDPAATNYDPAATVDDGSCTYGSTTWYEDSDSDTYGNPNVSQMSTTQPPGYVLDNTDCDDTDGNVNPGATEVCDGVDNNCDGNTDEGVLNTYYRDFDNDTYGNPGVTIMACSLPTGYVTNNLDCNDNNSLEFPGQEWFKDFDGDDYSDGVNLTQCTRPTPIYYAASELTATSGDCDDEEAAAFPGNPEVCDGIDNNCNTLVDEGVLATFYLDFDSDGFGDPTEFIMVCDALPGYVDDNTDCDDNDPLEFPGQTWYKDVDGDLYGDGTSQVSCERPADYYVASELTATSGDCNDNDNTINPAASEVCGDGIDNNCDGNTDEGCSLPPCDGTSLNITTISQNSYHAEIDITSDALANNGQSILFSAGEEISFNNDFEVASGTEFTALIAPCDASLDSPDEEEVDRIQLEDILLDISSDIDLEEADANIEFKIYNKYGEVVAEGSTEYDIMAEVIKEKLDALPLDVYLIAISKEGQKKTYQIHR